MNVKNLINASQSSVINITIKYISKATNDIPYTTYSIFLLHATNLQYVLDDDEKFRLCREDMCRTF